MSTESKAPFNHEENAAAAMTKAREIAQSVPGFAFAVKGRRRKITTSASAPDEFLETVAVACDSSPQIGLNDNLTAAELRDCILSSRVYTSLGMEMIMIGRGILDTVAENRNGVSKRARRVYKYAKDLDHPEERELLVPHVENMKRTLGRGRPKTKTAPPPPDDVPTIPAKPATGGAS
jgi:tRNA-dihydrouridine synthase